MDICCFHDLNSSYWSINVMNQPDLSLQCIVSLRRRITVGEDDGACEIVPIDPYFFFISKHPINIEIDLQQTHL